MIPTSRLAAFALAIFSFPLALHATDSTLDGAFVSTISPGMTPDGYPTFNSGTGAVNAVALQSDGKILVGGNISRYKAPPAGSPQSSLKRLNPDGTLDSAFGAIASTLADSQGQTEVNEILTVAGDKLYVGGVFTSYDGTPRGGILRLNSDGSLDTGFNTSGISNSSTFGLRYVLALVEQPDEKLLVAGGYNRANGTFRPGLARFNSDGSLDTSFNPFPALPTDTSAQDIALLPNGQILVGGGKPRVGGGYVPLLVRLNADGSLDSSLAPSFSDTYGDIDELLVLPDGRILISGDFAFAPSGAEHFIACLQPDGSLDTTFMANLGSGPSGWAGGELVLQPDGTILVGGIFKSWNNQPRASIVRLFADGTLDTTFAPPPYIADNSYLTHFYSFAVQPDGKLLAGGWFNHVTDPALETYNLTRFNNEFGTGPGTLRVLSSALTTTENAASVALQVSRFGGLAGAVSVNFTLTPLTAIPGTDYTPISGTLTWANGVGGIQTIPVPILQDTAQDGLKTLQLILSDPTGGAILPPANAATLVSIRDDDAPPVIVLEPISVSIDQGANFSLTVLYDSVPAATVKWQRDSGSGFTDIPGATSTIYTVSSADPALNGGSYRAIVTNLNGSDTSLAVNVTVRIPAGSVVTSFVPPSDTPVAKFATLDSSGRFLIGDLIGLRRLTASGTLDPTTTFGINVSGLNAILPLADGTTLLGGSLGTLTHLPTNTTSTVSNRLVRLNADGTIDGTYIPTLNGAVSVLASGASGKFYAGVIGATSVGLQRFLSTGAADSSLNVPASTVAFGSAGRVWSVKEQPDGKILVSYTNGTSGFGGSATIRLTRLHSSGALDTTFGSGGHVTLPSVLTGLDILPDGDIAIAARFNNSIFPGSQYLALLNPDGSQNTSFSFGTGILDGNPNGITYRDGRLLVWGSFTTVNGKPQAGLLRLNLDGSPDPTFAVGTGIKNAGNITSPYIASAVYTNSGDIFVAGAFTEFKSVLRKNAALLVGGPGAVSVASSTLSVLEGAASAMVTVKRFGTATSAVSVSYSTIAETATAGNDFTTATGTLSWAANDSADKTVAITLANNPAGEPNETFRLRLSAATPDTAATLALTDTVVTIVDDDNPPTITTPPASQSVAQGVTVTFTVANTAIPAATYRWTRDDVDLADAAGISGSDTDTLTLTGVGPANIGAYRVRVTNSNGSTTSDPAQLVIALNPAFTDAAWPTNLTINGTVNAIVPLIDGGAYVAGQFTNFNGQTGRSYLVKISSTGVVDTTFSPAPNAGVTKLVLNGDRLFALGTFTQIGGGTASNNFAALDAATGLRLGTFMTALGTGGNSTVRSLAVLTDGDLLLGGDFTSYNGDTNHRYLSRINPDGTLHSPFNTSAITGNSNVVSTLGAGPNGTFVAGGTFTYGTATRMVRFNADGSRDATFAPAGITTSTIITRIRVLADGRVMASGSSLPPSNRVITRLSATGVWDSADYFGQSVGTFNDFVLQTNGRSVGVGSFNFVGTPVNFSNIASFSTVGALSQTWVGGAGLGGTAFSAELAENGNLWIGGDFTTYNGSPAQRLIRLNGDIIPLGITLHPKPVNANPGTTATFTARATGTTTVSYRWLRNGVELSDGGNISGSATPTLTLANVSDADEDNYSVRATNLFGNETSSPAALVVLGAPEILTQPAATLTSYTGRPFSLAVTARGIAPLTYQWRKGGVPVSDGSGITGANTATLTFASLTLSNSGEYDLIVTGTSATPSGTFSLTVLPNPVERVATFSSLATTTNGITYAILPLADGGALIGGQFTGLLGAGSTATAAACIGRVLPDGTVAKLPFLLNGNVRDIVRLPGGKFLVAGDFSTVTPTGSAAVTRNRILRINADFSFDPTFDPGVTAPSNSYVYSLALDSLGRIYAAGDFASWNGKTAHSRLVRLRPDGSHDTSFTATFNGLVRKVVVTADGKLYAGGSFNNYQGRSYFVRLTEAGDLDSTFAPSLSNSITTLVVQPDGKLLAISGITLSRFLDTGAADTSFPSLSTNGLLDVTLQADGRIIISGTFTTLGGVARYGLMRLTSEGAVDPTFDVTGQTSGLAFTRVDGYGRIWLGGNIGTYNGVPAQFAIPVLNGDQVPLGVVQDPDPVAAAGGQNAVFRITATGTSALSYQWLRNELPLSDDGHFSGTNTATLTILNIQPGDEAFYAVTVTNTSGNVTSNSAELIYLAGPEILTTPLAITTEVGQSATFIVEARGAGTLTYEWLKGTEVLTNSSTVTGATTNALTLSNLALTTGGSYAVRITNDIGSVTTSPFVLTVFRSPSALAPGLVIPTFNNTVNAVLPLADGTFLAGGVFTSVTHPSGSATRNRFAKIKADGSPDITWPTVNNTVNCIAQDSAGRIYLGGTFTQVTPAGGSATSRVRLLRLSSTGVLDSTFAPLTAPNNTVRGIRFDSAGRIYVFGDFTNYGLETGSAYIVRLNDDGSRDATFVSSGAASIADIEFASGNRLWLSHANAWAGQSRIVLVDDLGAKDAGFTYAGFMTSTGVETLADGSALSFSNSSPYIQKISTTGAITSPFPVGGGPGGAVNAHGRAGDQFYLNGNFTSYAGVTSGNFVRINSDGTRDTTFDGGSGFNGALQHIVTDSQGRVWCAGGFTSYKGDTNLTRLVVLNGGVTETNSGTPADPLADFLANAGVPANLRGPNDDADNDGLDNLLEYALDLNPNGSGGAFSGSPITSEETATHLNFTYRRVRNDVTYVVETSPTLSGGTWTSVGVTQGTPAGDGTTTASIPITPGSQFLRLSVTR